MNRQSSQAFKYYLPLFAVAASLLLSAWKIGFAPLVNHDAILYLIATEELISSGLSESLKIYSWPFFQLSIATIHQVTGLELLTCGRILMSACFLALVLAFIRLVKDLGGDSKTQWLALALILCHPEVNDLRSSLVRDPGMLAFMLLALSEQLRFAVSGHWQHSLKWFAYITIAFLFRVEALALAALGPLGMLVVTNLRFRDRLVLAVKMLAVPVAIAAAVFLALPETVHAQLKVLNDLDFFLRNAIGLSDKIGSLADILTSRILGEYSGQDATLALTSIFLTLTIASILRAVSGPYLLPLLLAWLVKTPAQKQKISPIVWWYALIVFVYLFSFSLFTQFSLTRYGLQLAILLLLPLPFYFRQWWDNCPRQQLARGLIICLFVVNGLDSLISSEGKKAYIRDAAVWLSESTSLAGKPLITNEPYIGYFGARSNSDSALRAINAGHPRLTERKDTLWLAGHVYAHRIEQGEAEGQLKRDIARGKGEILHVFPGGDNRSVYLFTVGRDTPRSPLLLDGAR